MRRQYKIVTGISPNGVFPTEITTHKTIIEAKALTVEVAADGASVEGARRSEAVVRAAAEEDSRKDISDNRIQTTDAAQKTANQARRSWNRNYSATYVNSWPTGRRQKSRGSNKEKVSLS